MTDKISLKPALAVLENGPTNELQTPSSITAVTDQDYLEEGEITEEDGSSTASTPPRIAGQLLKTSSSTNLPSESAQSSRLSSPSITACGSIVASTAPQYSDAGPSMTREDLDHTKNLVLDLLGWGVSPEYLVEAGVSSGVLYRVFSDLNLRLPTNLVLPPTQTFPPSGIR
ncbi:hypothetical protein DEU56DRAFT_830035 [Suillus clintonianus]|uniref:uncharacterized protein n=1 Tax=Suillus clintonianus TaxID=1904413 RepID=UPI001B86C233|nr:uncharacterized protein DEU56DRAFT_830035 [Suillus clintonianus]KAG2123269.1 hypothetical protein DEU56DRAFT_830035 [Suillus clintonianus]